MTVNVNPEKIRQIGDLEPEPVPEVDFSPVNPVREYVAGGAGTSWNWSWFNTLPTPEDDLDNLVGNDVYTRMGNDEQVLSSTLLLIMMTLRRPMRFDAAYADHDEGSENFRIGQELRDAWLRTLENMKRHGCTPFRLNFEMLFNAMRYGNAVAEINLEPGEGEDSGKLPIHSIKVKPRHSYAFVVDAFFNLLGLSVYRGPYHEWVEEMSRVMQVASGGTAVGTGELGGHWRFVERRKFALLSVLTENNDPRGKSWWRAAYNAWWGKMRRLRQLDLFCQRFALPIPKGKTAPDAPDQYERNPDGTDNTSKPKITAQEAMLRSLIRMQAGDAIVVPDGAEVDMIPNANDGGALSGALSYHDSQIVKAITFQKLATSPDAHQAKNAGEVHQDVLNSSPAYLQVLLQTMWDMDIIGNWVETNYGREYRKYAPKSNLPSIAAEDLVKVLTAMATARREKFIPTSMLPEIWAELGLPPVNIKAWLEEMQATEPAPADPANSPQ